jgi:RHS repeat-associated protein
LPNGIKEVYNYDSMDRLVGIEYVGTGKTISYTYDLAGNLLTTTDWTGTTTYSYDNIYQLTSQSLPNNTTITYSYDPAGNRITQNSITYSYNNLNQLISKSDNTTYTYDLNGNLITKTTPTGTTTYSWNAYDKLTSVILPDGKEIRFVYGADGLRRERIEGERVNYLLDGLNVICEFSDSGEVLREYVPGVSVSIGGFSYFYHYDRLGSVRVLSDEVGDIVQEYFYDAFGNLVSSSGSLEQPYQFVGEQYYYTEPIFNLLLLGQRWYDPEIGRFISRDPVEDVNLYLYVKNNPVNYIDPSGKGIISDIYDQLYQTCMKLQPGQSTWVNIIVWPTPNPCLWLGYTVWVHRTNNPWFPCIFVPIPLTRPVKIDPCCLIS